MSAIKVTVVIPCLNESKTIAECVVRALRVLHQAGISGEILVSDNGSVDHSRKLAESAGARVIEARDRGYGFALRAGFEAALGEYIFMADADCSYDFSEIPAFVSELEKGCDLVMGCRLPRFGGTIEACAMPVLHRILGNPGLSWLARKLYSIPIHDVCCGMRAFRRQAVLNLELHGGGMEFALEMLLKAQLTGLNIRELPITLYPDKRDRRPHLRTWSDGWSHARYLLLMAPAWLFLYPGLVAFFAGGAALVRLVNSPIIVGRVGFDTNSMIVASALFIVGGQALFFALIARIYFSVYGLVPGDRIIERVRAIGPFEAGIFAGTLSLLGGIFGLLRATEMWSNVQFSAMSYSEGLRVVVPSVTAIIYSAIFAFGGALTAMMLSLARTRTGTSSNVVSLESDAT